MGVGNTGLREGTGHPKLRSQEGTSRHPLSHLCPFLQPYGRHGDPAPSLPGPLISPWAWWPWKQGAHACFVQQGSPFQNVIATEDFESPVTESSWQDFEPITYPNLWDLRQQPDSHPQQSQHVPEACK